MGTPYESLDTEQLLEHSEWLRRLARQLVRDDATAEDLSQETWAALGRRGTVGIRDLRAFLGGTLRKLALKRARSEGRRTHHEGAAARPEPIGSPEELAEKLEVQRAILEELSSMGAETRTAILHRYYEGHTAADVARSQGVPQGTVRARLKRGLDELRGRLDRRFGGRRSWCVVLAGISKGHIEGGVAAGAAVQASVAVGSAAGLGGLLMSKLVLAFVVVLLAASGALWFGADHGEDLEALPEVAAVETPMEETILAGEPVESGRTPAIAVAEESPAVEPSGSSPTAMALATLTGRFLLPAGSPAEGVALSFEGMTSNAELARKFGLPKDWQDQEVETGPDGRFTFLFDPPRAYQFFLAGKLGEYADTRWRWGSLPPGEVTDVGDVVLTETGSIAGRLIDRAGKPLEGAWRISVETSYRQAGPAGNATRASGTVDPKTGEFRIDRVPPGTAELKAHSAQFGWVKGPIVVVQAGEASAADIVYEGPDNSRRILISTRNRAFHTHSRPAPGTIIVRGESGEVVAERVAGSSQSWSAADLAPGQYTIEVTDPNYEPWSKSGVQPGQKVNAHLRGSAAVELSVRDSETGEPVARYEMRLRFRNAHFGPNIFRLRKDSDPEPPEGLYDALMPGDLTIVVAAPGYAPFETDLTLGPGETRDVEVALERGGVIAGRTVDADGEPVAGIAIRLAPHLDGRDPSDPFAFAGFMSLRSAFEDRTRETVADDAGRFSFEAVASGAFDITATVSDFVSVSQEVEVATGLDLDVRLVLPPMGWLAGRLVGPPDVLPEGFWVSAFPSDRADQSFFRAHTWPRSEVSADGAYRLGPFPAGKVTVELVLDVAWLRTFRSSGGASGARRELGTVTIRGGEETERDFDLRESYPARIEISARINGELAP
ncbi:MAG: sigma-70 family RNA polymerase sigma factor, partial [Planctomycetota bacterium]